MQLLRISDELALAFGLTWDGHDQIERSLHAQIVLWQARGYTLACKYERLGDSIYGLDSNAAQRDQGNNKRDKAQWVSGAGLIALHPTLQSKTGLVVIEVQYGDNPLAIVVGLKNGLVILDRLADLHDVESLRNQFITLLPSNTPWTTWGQVKNIALGIEHDLSFDALLNKRLFGKLTLQPLRSTQPWLIAGAVAGAGMVLGLAWMGWDYVVSEQSAAEALRQAAFNTPEVMYQQEIAKLLATPITPLGDAVAAVRDQLAGFPVFAAGWQLDSVECAGSGASSSCTVSWLRKEGTLAEFQVYAASTHPDWTGIRLASQDKLVHALAITLPQAALPALKDWPRAKDFTERTYNVWQFFKPTEWAATLANPVQQALPQALLPDQLRTLANYAGAPMGMVLDVQEQPWWLAGNDALSPMQSSTLGATVALTGPVTLKFDVNSREFKFNVKGLAYVQP